MQVAYEVVPVFLRQTHEGAPHDNELHFVNAMAQLLQLKIYRGKEEKIRNSNFY